MTDYFLETGDGHTLYIEERGEGVPLLLLHGGPGAGHSPRSGDYIDTSFYRLILFDQRGAGRSTPLGQTRANTTADLIEDIEKIRIFLKIDQWMVAGGSWGASLALAYAQAHPQRVLGMILRSIFLGREEDLTWPFRCAARVWPDALHDLVEPLGAEGSVDADKVVAYYAEGIEGSKAHPLATRWLAWLSYHLDLHPQPQPPLPPERALAMARVQLHYLRHKLFLAPGALLDRISCVEAIPAILIHGRWDSLCPFEASWTLHRRWHRSVLWPIERAGHVSHHPEMHAALVEAGECFKEHLKNIRSSEKALLSNRCRN